VAQLVKEASPLLGGVALHSACCSRAFRMARPARWWRVCGWALAAGAPRFGAGQCCPRG